MKGHQNNPQSPRILSRRDHTTGFEMDGSDSVIYLKATDLQMHKSQRRRNSFSGGGCGVWWVLSPLTLWTCVRNERLYFTCCTYKYKVIELIVLSGVRIGYESLADGLFSLRFGSLTIFRLCNVFYILICQDMSNILIIRANFQGTSKILMPFKKAL